MSDKSTTDTIAEGAAGLQAAGEAARQVVSQARQAGGDAAGQAQELAHEAQGRVASLAGAMGERVQDAAESGKSSLADQIEDAAQAVHRSGTQLEGHQDWAAHLVERGAAELSTLATTLRSNDLRGLMGGLQDLAKRQPALFAGASLAAGFALARVGRIAVAGASKDDLPKLPEVHLGS